MNMSDMKHQQSVRFLQQTTGIDLYLQCTYTGKMQNCNRIYTKNVTIVF